jgi:endo-1,4-beta-xylanase
MLLATASSAQLPPGAHCRFSRPGLGRHRPPVPRATPRHARAAALLLGTLLPLAAPLPARTACRHGTATLRCAARRARVRIGVGYTYQPDKPDEAALVTREFDALTLEGELLWSVVHPEASRWNFAPADRAVAWAAHHRLYVTATHFVWDQIVYASTPAWVKTIDDPGQLRAVMRHHLATITHRYRRRVSRWIVVNEPLRYLGDTAAIQDNHFSRVLGPDWIAESFRIARQAAPHASLWLNEVFTETDARKAQALVELARTLVAAHVPIDGVGFQGHLFTPLLQPVAPDATIVADAMRAIATLGLQVALTEVDAPTFPDTPDRLAAQAQRVRALVEACLGVRRCTDVIFWDLQDAESWLNTLFHRDDLAPTLFDSALAPKPVYFAVREPLAAASPDGGRARGAAPGLSAFSAGARSLIGYDRPVFGAVGGRPSEGGATGDAPATRWRPQR